MLWDLRVGKRYDPVVARLGRFLTDVVDVKAVFAYPSTVVQAGDGPAVLVKPYYTMRHRTLRTGLREGGVTRGDGQDPAVGRAAARVSRPCGR